MKRLVISSYLKKRNNKIVHDRHESENNLSIIFFVNNCDFVTLIQEYSFYEITGKTKLIKKKMEACLVGQRTVETAGRMLGTVAVATAVALGT